MRYNYRTPLRRKTSVLSVLKLGVLIFTFISLGCNSDKEFQRQQFLLLENALDKISATKNVDWKDRLNGAAAINIDYPEIKRIQKLCISSYREYGDALEKLAQSRQQVKELEVAIANKDIENIGEKHKSAKAAISQTSRHLEQAEVYVQQCVLERHEMKKKLGIIGK